MCPVQLSVTRRGGCATPGDARRQARVPRSVGRSVAPYDADRLLYETRVPVRAVRGAVTQLDSRL
eukprot:6738860-Prymnesium_polylepis.1